MRTIKQVLKNMLAKAIGSKKFCKIINSDFSSHMIKVRFRDCVGTLKYPVLFSNTSVNGLIKVGQGTKFYNSIISVQGGLQIGMCTSLNGTYITSFINPIIIGNYCSIAAGTRIIESNHKIDRLTTYHYEKNILGKDVFNDIESKGSVTIEDDVWIGSNVCILSGVKIGRGSVIGAGSIVTKNIPPYSICVGIPAKVIKKRFDLETIQAIEGSEWWKRTPEEIAGLEALFTIDRVEADDIRKFF